MTVATGTTKAAPQITNLTMPPRRVTEVVISVPPGPRGEVGFALGSAGTAVLPSTTGQFIVADNEIIHWPLEGFWDSGAWQLIAFNTGKFVHAIEVRFLCELVTDGGAGSTPIIPADQLVPVISTSSPGGGPAPIPPSLDLGPFPGPAPAPPGLPPPPTPPAPPTLPTPPGIVLPGPPSPPSLLGGGPSAGGTVTRVIPDRMYDSTNAGDIPGEAVMVAYYDYWPSSTPSPPRADRFYVVITKDPSHLSADVIDVESGAASVQDAVAWVRAKQDVGGSPVVYGTGSTLDAVLQAARFYGFPAPLFWLAEYDNDPTIPTGYVAKQFANAALTGHHYDLSSVSPDWPGLRAWAGGQAPAPPPITPPPTGGGGSLYLWRTDVHYVSWNNQPQLFYIRPDGMLVQRVGSFTVPGPWVEYDLQAGCIPGALDVETIGNGLHVFALLTDGRVEHRWQVSGTTAWSSEIWG